MKLYLLIGYYCHRSYLFEKYKYWSNLMGYKTDFVRPEGEGSKGAQLHSGNDCTNKSFTSTMHISPLQYTKLVFQ